MRNSGRAELISASHHMLELKQEIDRIGRSDAKVVITGESGVGKELVARAIHGCSLRAARVFIPVNCAGLPETLLESELFGHVKGSFTNAYRDKPGKLESADGGTIFLDEVGEMSPRMQGMLLRFLETGELQKVGADRAGRTVDVRVIAATNRDLQNLIALGQFREDLFFRLNVIHLWVPPLRERKEDIPPLIDHFLGYFMRKNGSPVKSIEPDAVTALTQYRWPGNVRELENVIERLVVSGRNESVTLEDLPLEVRGKRSTAPRERRRTVTDDLYRRLLEDQESFWTAVYPLYMQREITKQNVRDLVRRGLEEVHGNYKVVCKLFNVGPNDYKKFLNFLRKHDCQLPFKEYRH
jgi:transcriptional regulator with PAS, ATPase and Fis domain